MKNTLLKSTILGLLIMLGTASSLRASRFLGGDITWQCVGKDSFLVKLTTYRECSGTSFSSASIPIRCKTGSLLTTLSIPLPSPIDITPTCGSSCTRCNSATCSFYYGIEEYNYQQMVYLGNNIPGSCCEIIMSYSKCCRSNNITTGLAYYNFYIEAMMNRCVTPCDNSPQFSKPPVLVMCIGQDFVFSPGVIDVDTGATGGLLDSLVYEWSPPLSASGTGISYTGQYDYDKSIYFWGFPNRNLPFPRGFHMDGTIGDISFRPMKLEQTVMVFTVKEYRYDSTQKKRVLIGQISRDVQVAVMNCPNNHPPMLSGPYYTEVCVGGQVEMKIQTLDYDIKDTLHIYWNQRIPDASWSDSNGLVASPTGILKWTPGMNDISSTPYTFTVTVEDNACPVKGQLSRTYQILVKPPIELDAEVVDSGCGMVWFNDKNSLFPAATYDWTFDDFKLSGKGFSHQFMSFGTFPYKLTKTDVYCGNITYYDTVRVDTFVQLQRIPEQKVCYGDSIELNIRYKYNKGSIGGSWDGVADSLTKHYYIDQDSQLVYGCIDSADGCAVYDTVRIDMLEPAIVDIGPDIHSCRGDSQLVIPNITINDIDSGFVYWQWLPQAKTDTVFGYRVGDTGTYVCFFKDTLGCVGMDTFHVTMNPEVRAFANGVIICRGDTAWLSASETGTKTSNVFYKWYWGNTLVDTGREAFFDPGVTTFYRLLVKEELDGLECWDTMNVTVKVNPPPGIYIDPIDERCISGLNSQALKLSDYVLTNPVNSNTEWSYWPDSNALQGEYFYPSIAGTGNHIVTIKATDPITSCVGYDSSNIMVNPLPNVDAGLDDTLCIDDGSKLLIGYPSDPPGSWSNLGSHQGVEDHVTYWSFNPKASGIVDGGSYGIVYDYTDSNGCENTDTAFMVVYENPVADAGVYDAFCAYDLENPLNGLPLNGIWFGNGIVNNHFNPSLAGSGSHELVYEFWDQTCTGRDTVVVEVIPIPVAGFKALGTGNEYEVRFNDLSSPGTGSLKTWRWDFGDGDTSVQKDPVHVYSGSGDYEVYLMISDDGVCTDILRKIIHVEKNTVGLEEESDHSAFVYPNPFESQIYIKSSAFMKQIEVYDLLGKKVASHNGLNTLEMEIEPSGEAGVLIVRILFFDQSSASYLVIKR